MKNKKWLLLLIIAFPSLFWLILESSTIQSKKLPYYGPKENSTEGDTLYYSGNTEFHTHSSEATQKQNGAFILSFLHPKYQSEAYRLQGFWEFLNYKQTKIAQIPFVFVFPQTTDSNSIENELSAFSKHKNIYFYSWNKNSFDSIWMSYFTKKPYYIDYSFFILVDAQSHIRGYYDIRYAAEMKRLIEEYRHLRLKEEKQKLIKNNEIETRT